MSQNFSDVVAGGIDAVDLLVSSVVAYRIEN